MTGLDEDINCGSQRGRNEVSRQNKIKELGNSLSKEVVGGEIQTKTVRATTYVTRVSIQV